MRAVYLDHCAQLSGGEIALLRRLDAVGGDFEAHVILGEDGSLRPRLEQRGIMVEVLALNRGALTTTRNEANAGLRGVVLAAQVVAHAWHLSRRIRQIKPDLVATNSLKSAVYEIAAARMAGVPVFCHLRDRLAGDSMPIRTTRVMRLILRHMPSAVLANSKATMHMLAPPKRALPVPGAVIHDPVPPHTGVPDGHAGDLVVGMVGRLSLWKVGGARAIIVGSALFSAGDYECRLRAQIMELGLDGRIELAGFTDDVAGYLDRFDILVHASVTPEPFGQVVAEGMAAGLPVIASDAGGPSEMITNGISGVLSSPGDVSALAEALQALGASVPTRVTIGAAARQKSLELAPDRVAAATVQFYGDLTRRPVEKAS